MDVSRTTIDTMGWAYFLYLNCTFGKGVTVDSLCLGSGLDNDLCVYMVMLFHIMIPKPLVVSMCTFASPTRVETIIPMLPI
jgi:hypothetical protein